MPSVLNSSPVCQHGPRLMPDSQSRRTSRREKLILDLTQHWQPPGPKSSTILPHKPVWQVFPMGVQTFSDWRRVGGGVGGGAGGG